MQVLNSMQTNKRSGDRMWQCPLWEFTHFRLTAIMSPLEDQSAWHQLTETITRLESMSRSRSPNNQMPPQTDTVTISNGQTRSHLQWYQPRCHGYIYMAALSDKMGLSIPHPSSNSTRILVLTNYRPAKFEVSCLHHQQLQCYCATEILLTQQNKHPNICQSTCNHLHGGPSYKIYLQNHFLVCWHTRRQTGMLKTIPAVAVVASNCVSSSSIIWQK